MKNVIRRDKKNKSKPDVSLLAWTFHPLRKNVKQAVMVIFLVLLFSAAVYWNWKEIFLSIMSLVIFVSSLSTFFFPTRYILEEDGITIKNIISQKFPWTRFHRYVQTKKGIFLSPYLTSCTMDSYRSIFLFCENDSISEVLNIVKRKVS